MKLVPPQTPKTEKIGAHEGGLGWPEPPNADDVSRETNTKPSGLGWPE